jgi:hypothetical protein
MQQMCTGAEMANYDPRTLSRQHTLLDIGKSLLCAFNILLGSHPPINSTRCAPIEGSSFDAHLEIYLSY